LPKRLPLTARSITPTVISKRPAAKYRSNSRAVKPAAIPACDQRLITRKNKILQLLPQDLHHDGTVALGSLRHAKKGLLVMPETNSVIAIYDVNFAVWLVFALIIVGA
jgi:hypothetical protein